MTGATPGELDPVPELDPELPILSELEALVHAAAVTAGHRPVGSRRPGHEGPRRSRERVPQDTDAKPRR